MKHSGTRGKKYSIKVLIPRMRAQAEKEHKIKEQISAGTTKAKERQVRKQTPKENVEIGNILDEQ
jgi:hypothetical protein